MAQFFGNSLESLKTQMDGALSELKAGFSGVIPVVTTNEDGEHAVLSWDLQGEAAVQYSDNTNIPQLKLETTQKLLDLHQITVQIEKTAIDELRARQKKNLALTDDVIRSALGLSVEEKMHDVLMNGIDGETEGLKNLPDALVEKSKLTTAAQIKEALLKSRKGTIKNGARPNGMFTVLMPLDYEEIMKDPLTDAISQSLEEFLMMRYGILIFYSDDYDRIIMFQDTFGNIYFQRDENIEIEERKAYENTSRRWFAIITLVGLVVKNQKQIAYIDKDTTGKKP